MDLDEVRLQGALERNDALDEEGVGVLKVEMHDAHHRDSHHLRAHQGLELSGIVGVNRGGNKLALLRRAHRRRLDIFEGGEVCTMRVSSCKNDARGRQSPGNDSEQLTLLLVDDDLGPEVDAEDDEVAESVARATGIEDKGVFEGDPLGELHHTKDDHQVRAVGRIASAR